MNERWVIAGARVETRLLQAIGLFMGGLAPLASRATVPILFIALVIFVGLAVIQRLRVSYPGRASLWSFGFLILWAATSAAWSATPANVIRSVVEIAVLFGTGLVLLSWAYRAALHNSDVLQWVSSGLLAGLAVGLLVYAFEGISGGWLTRMIHGFSWPDIIDDLAGGTNVRSYLINGTAILSLLLWPALAVSTRVGRRWHTRILGGLVVVATAYFGSDSGLIALALGALCWAAAMRWGRRATRTVAVVFAIAMLTAPYILYRTVHAPDLDKFVTTSEVKLPSSAVVRLYIWKFTTDRIAERPWLGWGFNSARNIPGGGDKFVVKDAQGHIRFEELNLPLHPHNQILQVWLELGAVGAVIVALGGAFLIAGLGNWPPRARAAGLALVATAVVYDSLSFGAWQSWWIAAVFLAAALLATASSHEIRA